MVLSTVGADVIEESTFPVKAFVASPCRLPTCVDAVELALVELVPGLFAISPVSAAHQLPSVGVISTLLGLKVARLDFRAI